MLETSDWLPSQGSSITGLVPVLCAGFGGGTALRMLMGGRHLPLMPRCAPALLVAAGHGDCALSPERAPLQPWGHSSSTCREPRGGSGWAGGCSGSAGKAEDGDCSGQARGAAG